MTDFKTNFLFGEKPTSPRFQDVEGQRFNRLLVLGYIGRRRSDSLWLCLCDCGKTTQTMIRHLNNKETQSCGCLQKDRARQAQTTHNHSRTRLYDIFMNMIARCEQINHPRYKNYGGRGITVCSRWRHAFLVFRADMGEPPSSNHSLDRIDNNGNYTPANCRWATPRQQANNKSTNHLLTLGNKTQSLAMWSRELNIRYDTLKDRIYRGWSHEKALTTPVKS